MIGRSSSWSSLNRRRRRTASDPSSSPRTSTASSSHLLELDALLAAVEEVLVDPLRELVRPAERHTDCDEGAGHQTLGVRLIRSPERQRLGVAGMAHARAPVATSRWTAASSSGRDDLVLGEDDLRTALERRFCDDVDRRGLDLDEIDVGIRSREVLAQLRAVGEIARHADNVRVEMIGRRRPGREHRDPAPLQRRDRPEAQLRIDDRHALESPHRGSIAATDEDDQI